MRLYKVCNKISLLLHALCSAAGYFLIEAISRHSFVEAWNYMTGKPLVFAYNVGLIFVTSLIAYLFRRRTFWRVLIAIFWLLLGIINGIILANRVTPFTGPDLHLLTDGMAILNKYLPAWGVIIALIVLGLFVLILLALLIRGPKYKRRVKFRYDLLMVVIAVAAFAGITQLALDKRVLSNYFGNIAFAYEDYGYPYCLAVTIFDTGISCPRDYSEKEIRRIEKTEDNLPATSDSSKPNILFLQLESFFDPTLVNYLKISEDPIPTFHKIQKEYTSGYLKVPVYGAGTINTEFEVITGMNMDYFGTGEYPYRSILHKTTCDSVAYWLKEKNYESSVIHNNNASFYDRDAVFSNLGFNNFITIENMDVKSRNEVGWAKDSILTTYIMDTLNQTKKKDIIYTISVQGHGDYPTDDQSGSPITVSGEGMSQSYLNQFTYYVNQTREMDDFIKDLTDKLSDYPEDVMVIAYGDHLPGMNLESKDLKTNSKYETPYFIWDNFGYNKENKKKQSGKVEAWQLASKVLKEVGIHNGFLNEYHQTMEEDKKYRKNLKLLQYDMLYGSNFVREDKKSLEPTKINYSLSPVEITEIKEDRDDYLLLGNNFTDASRVFVNGVRVASKKESSSVLEIPKSAVKEGDKITVHQVSVTNENITLNQSEEYEFHKDKVRLLYKNLYDE